MKIVVEQSKCAGHARCKATAPAFIELDEDGYIDVMEINVSEGQETLAVRAVKACPERVMQIVDES